MELRKKLGKVLYKFYTLIPCLIWKNRKKDFKGKTFFPWIIVTGTSFEKLRKEEQEEVIRHEKIHHIQMIEWGIPGLIVGLMLYLVFPSLPLWWVVGGLITFFQPLFTFIEFIALEVGLGGHTGYTRYRNLTVELEAHDNDKNIKYLEKRPIYNTVKYRTYIYDPFQRVIREK